MDWTRDRVILITGCSSGIGRALALEFQRRGHRCFASARRDEALADLRAAGLDTVRLDVTDRESIDAAVAEVKARAGRIDMLVNNAGFGLFGPLAEVPLRLVRDLYETNVLGPLAMIQAVFHHMAEQRHGRIVNVGSMVGVVPTPFAGAYCGSKAALHVMSEVLRAEARPFGIEVIVVQPGSVQSDIAVKSPSNLGLYRSEGSRYRAVAREIEARAGASQEKPMSAETFARKLVAALTRKRAPAIVRLGANVAVLRVLDRLPGSVRTALLARRFGLDRLAV